MRDSVSVLSSFFCSLCLYVCPSVRKGLDLSVRVECILDVFLLPSHFRVENIKKGLSAKKPGCLDGF